MTAAQDPEDNKDPRRGRIALCLSGGGLRATLYHLGVIKALRACHIEGDRAIDRIDHVYAVSGGSILAGHMLMQWEAYRDPDEAVFKSASDALIAFARSNIRDRVLRRWFLQAVPRRLWQAWRRNPASVRTQLLQSSYERLLGGVNIGACYPDGRRVPRFHFLSTDFKTGELCAFSGVNLEIEDRKGQCTATGCGNVKLAAAVAASSAFPPLFPPVLLPPDHLSHPPGIRFREALLLSDGGVYDNMGIEKLQKLFARDDSHPRIALISDAGAPFRVTARKSYSMIVGRNIRASDILMNRISDFTARSIDAMTKIDDVVIPITARVRNSRLNFPNQQLLRLVRTDLDIFDADIAMMLVDHGEAVALASLRGFRRINLPAECALELVSGDADPAPVAQTPLDTGADACPSGVPAGASAVNRPIAAEQEGDDPAVVAEPEDEGWPLAAEGENADRPIAAAPGAASPTRNPADEIASASRVADRLKSVADRASRRSFLSLVFDRQDLAALLSCYGLVAVLIGGSAYWISSYLERQGRIEQQAQIDRQLKEQNYQGRLLVLKSQLSARERQFAQARGAEASGDRARLRAILRMPPPEDAGDLPKAMPPTASAGSTAVPPRYAAVSANGYAGPVYIQFAGMKREEIVTLNTQLRSIGWNVQGASGERTGVAATKREVRYGGNNQEAAQRLADAVRGTGIVTDAVNTNKLPIIGAANLEIWISR